MVLPLVYLVLIITLVIICVGFLIEDWVVKSLGSLLLMATGVYLLTYGVEGITDTNLALKALCFVIIGVGFYIILTENLEVINNG